MKLGIISDIHSNYEALEAVVTALEKEDCVKILCCGDVVGYGPDPQKCVDKVRELGIACVRGNHDDLIRDIDRASELRDDVRHAIEWNYEQLSDDARNWVAALPRVKEYGSIEIVHASHVMHPEWLYVLDKQSVMANFFFQRRNISFHGHTHVPLIALHKQGTNPTVFRFQKTSVPPQHKALINAGSVGQPRDRNPDAAYIVFDSESREVELKRVPYDISKTQEKMKAAQLPEKLIQRLKSGN